MGKCRQNATPLHRPSLEHVVDGGQDGGDDGHDHLFGAAPGFDAVELSLQVAVFLLTAAQAHCTSVVTACELSLKSENFSDLDGRELVARETNVLIARRARCLFAAHGPAVVRIVNKARTSGVE